MGEDEEAYKKEKDEELAKITKPGESDQEKRRVRVGRGKEEGCGGGWWPWRGKSIEGFG